MKDKIGIFFSNQNSLIKEFNRIHYSIKSSEIIERIKKHKVIETETEILYFILPSDSSKGQKFDIIYYERDIKSDILNSIIIPTCPKGRVLPFEVQDYSACPETSSFIKEIQLLLGEKRLQIGIRTDLDYFTEDISDISITEHTVYLNIECNRFGK